MEKEKFIPYYELCRHYLDIVDKFVNLDLPSDDLHLTIFQRDLVDASNHLMEYSRALHDSIISSCVEYNLDYSPFVK